MLLMVPPADGAEWPTLGPQVCDWIEAKCVHGIGDLLGEPVVLDAQQRGLIYSAYEVAPEDSAVAGRRRFYRVGWSLRRGLAKTELAGFIAAAELADDGPVRCGGFDADGDPVGAPLRSPLVLIFSASEEQADDTSFAALKATVEHGPLANELYVTNDLIARLDGSGQAKSLAAAPSSNEGRLVTFAWFGETHRATRPAVRQAHKVVRDGMPKRKVGDPWVLEETTAFVPGEDSIAEQTFDYAHDIAKGNLREPRLFFFHRQAADNKALPDRPLSKIDDDDRAEAAREALRDAVIEATGDAALEWTDVDRIVSQWEEPDADIERLEQVWLNRPVKSSAQVIDIAREWDPLAVDEPYIPAAGRTVTLGFDGSRVDDGTGIVGTDLETGYQWVHAHWDPHDKRQCPDGEVPSDGVRTAFDEAFRTWQVVRVHAEPYHWRETIDNLAGEYGREIVIAWWSNRQRQTAFAVDRWVKAIRASELSHSGDKRLRSHVANARKRWIEVKQPETGRRMFMLAKDREDSPRKIDLADCSWQSWEARGDAVARGALQPAAGGAAWFL